MSFYVGQLYRFISDTREKSAMNTIVVRTVTPFTNYSFYAVGEKSASARITSVGN